MFSLLPYTESILKSPAGQMIYCHISIKSPYNQIFLRTGTKCRQSVVKKHFNGTFLLPFSQNKKARLIRQALVSWRREGDSNPRAGIRRQHDFQSCTLNRSDTSPCCLFLALRPAPCCFHQWLTDLCSIPTEASYVKHFLKIFLMK